MLKNGTAAMTGSEGFVAVESYRKAAQQTETAVWNYKGLAIHALPAIHEYVGEMLRTSLPAGASVLDLASGSGALCLRLHDLGFNPTGSDLVAENFRLHGKIKFRAANLNDPIPQEFEAAFNCVTAIELIEHLENPRHLLRQCYRALRPGGILVLSTPNIESPIALAQFLRTGESRWFTEFEYRNDGHITPIPVSVLRRALHETGFEEANFTSVAPLRFDGFVWWKMRLLAFFMKVMSGRHLAENDIVVVCARKPG
jgi:SAM-dependent methyltransferase